MQEADQALPLVYDLAIKPVLRAHPRLDRLITDVGQRLVERVEGAKWEMDPIEVNSQGDKEIVMEVNPLNSLGNNFII